ncbi:unnamed protein product [Linum tenue]|uniref:Uncharacterized protein n=1 Tax=Linum tenue TaxID=586396 RepID=A0AAV0S713_9ROSI|nr:unnamed protein product [Linum tenue]
MQIFWDRDYLPRAVLQFHCSDQLLQMSMRRDDFPGGQSYNVAAAKSVSFTFVICEQERESVLDFADLVTFSLQSLGGPCAWKGAIFYVWRQHQDESWSILFPTLVS